MDKTTELVTEAYPEATDEREMAHVLFAGLNGYTPTDNSLELARQYWSRQFTSPWDSRNNPDTAGYSERFFSSLEQLTQSSQLLQRWRSRFDQSLYPEAGVARRFIADFMQAIMHYPRSYHDFSCHQQRVHAEHVMDFPIRHPLAVDYWTVYISNTGLGCLNIDGERRLLGEHTVLVVAPGQGGSVSRADGADSWSYDMLSFRSSSRWLELLDWAFSLDQSPILAIAEPQWQRLHQSISQLENTTYQAGHASERLCHNLIENILIHLRLAREQQLGGPEELDPRLQTVISYLLLYYDQAIELGEISARVRLSPGQLNALFRRQFGSSVIKWRDGLRLQKAKELLVFTVLPVNEVAEQVGYQDPLYFSRRFKKQFGLSPRAWRNQTA